MRKFIVTFNVSLNDSLVKNCEFMVEAKGEKSAIRKARNLKQYEPNVQNTMMKAILSLHGKGDMSVKDVMSLKRQLVVRESRWNNMVK